MTSNEHISLVERYEELRDLFRRSMVTFELIKNDISIDNTTTLYNTSVGLVLCVNNIKYKLFHNHIHVESYKHYDILLSNSHVMRYLQEINEILEMYLVRTSICHTITINHPF